MGPAEVSELLANRIIQDAEFRTKRELEHARWGMRCATAKAGNVTVSELTEEQLASIDLIIAPMEKDMRTRFIMERIEKIMGYMA